MAIIGQGLILLALIVAGARGVDEVPPGAF
jgi:hypothetical protein